MALDTIDNIHTLARILQSEASVGNASEQTAVGWTALNRMMRNRTERVSDIAGAYSTRQPPTAVTLELAKSVLKGNISDPTDGATHFYSPRRMPKEGQATAGFDVGGGLELVPPLKEKNYRPSWAASFLPVIVSGTRPHVYKFHKATGTGPVF